MKFKFEIDLEDLVNGFAEDYVSDGEYQDFVLLDEIKQSIVRQVTHVNLGKEINEMRDICRVEFRKILSERMHEIVEKQIERMIAQDKFLYARYKEELTMEEYVRKMFDSEMTTESSYSETLKKTVINIAKNQAEVYKERYDLLFASQMVSNLDRLGLLKEDAAKILLQKEGE